MIEGPVESRYGLRGGCASLPITKEAANRNGDTTLASLSARQKIAPVVVGDHRRRRPGRRRDRWGCGYELDDVFWLPEPSRDAEAGNDRLEQPAELPWAVDPRDVEPGRPTRPTGRNRGNRRGGAGGPGRPGGTGRCCRSSGTGWRGRRGGSRWRGRSSRTGWRGGPRWSGRSAWSGGSGGSGRADGHLAGAGLRCGQHS